ncbi:MbtH family protein [Streptomyces sulphureus]|uniref:MbtH family protein n=1 Tax=Streptomyces sulphureus TaxID=47758 RepID=UPI0003700E99|nr:MbtH family protein [Streptomyces sulphureus]
MTNEQRGGPFRVVVNHEEQYSLWPTDRENAPGWGDEGTVGDRETCLLRIEEIWRDMRPASLRARMAREGKEGAADE